MKIGTESLLLGAHQFILHPLVLAYSWWKLWGFQRVKDPYVSTHLLDWRLWFCFLVHDWGYWGKPEMDGDHGEAHPFLGARLASWLLDGSRGRWYRCTYRSAGFKPVPDGKVFAHYESHYLGQWGLFCLTHSRFLAKHVGFRVSALCAADKYSISVLPGWAYIPMTRLTGEIHDYMVNGSRGEWAHHNMEVWYQGCRDRCKALAMELKPEVTRPGGVTDGNRQTLV